MAKFDTIKTAIDANINTNGNQAITGSVMNSVLKQMVDSTDAELTELESEVFSDFINIEGAISLDKGLDVVSTSYMRSEYLYINKYKPIIFNNAYSAENVAVVAFYDEELNYIKGFNGSETPKIEINIEEIPQNAKFVRFCTVKGAIERGVEQKNNSINSLSRAIAVNVKDIVRLKKSEETHSKLLERSLTQSSTNSVLIPFNKGGYVVFNGGYIAESEHSGFSDYIDISNISRIWTNVYIGEGGSALSFYDKYKVYLPQISISSSYKEQDFKITDEIRSLAKYVRLSYYASNEEESSKRNIAYIKKWVFNYEEERITQLENKMSNVFYNSTIQFENKGYILANGIDIGGTDGYSRNSDLIELKGIEEIYTTCVIGETIPVLLFYDEDNNYLADLAVLGSVSIHGFYRFTEEQKTKAKYFRIQFYANSEQQAIDRGIVKVVSYNSPMPISDNVKRLSKLFADTNKGLNVLIFGDSITDCASINVSDNKTTGYKLNKYGSSYINQDGETVEYSMWPYIVTEYINCKDVRNYARSGASYKTRETTEKRQNLEYQVDLAFNDILNPNGVFPTEGEFKPDIIIFALGTNDGTPNDSFESAMEKTVYSASGDIDFDATLGNLDMTKFCEAARCSFMRVKKKFPTALNICVLPIQRADREQDKIGVNSELEKMAKRYSMVVVDGFSNCGIVRELESFNSLGVALKDGLHPNDIGQRLYARMMVSAIKNNYND